MNNISKKAVVGIGMLMIFIATILVSSIAAGVMIRSTGLLQERALRVSEAANERLVTGVNIFAVYGNGTPGDETIDGLELLSRVRAGSPPIQMKTLGMSFVSENGSLSATLNESIIGGSTLCNFSSVIPDTQFCFQPRIGNNDTILEEGELIAIVYRLSSSYRLSTEQDFEVTLQPKRGALEVLELRTPELVLKTKERLR